jgi:hypothetical protein
VFQLKPLSPDALPAAVGKAERYRLLNEPGEAESICLDFLAVDADHQPGDRDADPGAHRSISPAPGTHSQALDLVPRLAGAYERAYYSGIDSANVARSRSSNRAGAAAAVAAREWLHDALEHYAEAEPLRPAGNDDAILRWNACVRLLDRLPAHEPSTDSGLLMLE